MPRREGVCVCVGGGGGWVLTSTVADSSSVACVVSAPIFCQHAHPTPARDEARCASARIAMRRPERQMRTLGSTKCTGQRALPAPHRRQAVEPRALPVVRQARHRHAADQLRHRLGAGHRRGGAAVAAVAVRNGDAARVGGALGAARIEARRAEGAVVRAPLLQ